MRAPRRSIERAWEMRNGRVLSPILVLLLLQVPAPFGLLAAAQAGVRRSSGVDHRAARRPQPPPVRRNLSVAPQIAGNLAGHSSTLLPDGQTLLVGGATVAGAVSYALMREAGPGRLSPVAGRLSRPRAWHSATLLSDGTVFILGGVGSRGVIAEPEIFDPATGMFTSLPPSPLTARAHHTATLLTDGRVLVAGGIGPHGKPVSHLELWNPRSRESAPTDWRLAAARRGHTARLLADGNVEMSGGVTGDGAPAGREVVEVAQPFVSVAPPEDLRVVDSIPFPGSEAVPVDAVLSFRLSRPLQVTSVNPATLSLSEDRGPVPAKVVPAEGGMLAFLTPEQVLRPNTRYRLLIAGARDTNGYPLPQTEIAFSTEAVPEPTQSNGKAAEKQKEDPAPPPLQGPAGATALYGHSRTIFGKYLAEITVNLDCGGKVSTARSDSLGRFLVATTEAGHCELEIDGTTAREPGRSYGRFFVGVSLTAGRTNALPYTVWMTPLDRQHEVTIPSPTTSDVVITHPQLKGLELRLPPGTVIRDYQGQVLTRIGITPIPVGRPPFPLPQGVSVPIYFTIQPGGAYVEVGGSRYSPGKGATLVYPNSGRAPAGARYNFWDYDPEGRGWYVYGTGRVTANRRSIVPDTGVVIARFTGAMVADPKCCVPDKPVAKKPGCQFDLPWLPPCPPNPCNDCAGDPVVPSTGLFTMQQIDLSVADVLPLPLIRTYRAGDHYSRDFGVGATHQYAMFMIGDTRPYTYQDLILPDSSRVHFTRISAGTSFSDAVYEHTSTASPFYKATLRWNATLAGWDLKVKDGATFHFPDSDSATEPNTGRIRSIKDRYGNTITITRDRVTSPSGRWIQFTRDAAGRIIRAQDNGGRAVTYEYDEGGRLAKITDPTGDSIFYTYDANDQMLTMTNQRGIPQIANEYDSAGRVFRQTLADGGVYQFAYTEDANGNIIRADVTDPRGNVRRMNFDTESYFSGGNQVQQTLGQGSPEQRTTTYERQPGSSLVLSVTDALNRKTAFTYDAQGNVLTATRLAGTPSAVTTAYAYEPTFSQVTRITDPLNHATQMNYDSSGKLTSIVDPLNITTSFGYNSAGQVTSVTRPSGSGTLEYTAGMLSGIVDRLGNRTTVTVNSIGQVVALTNPLGQTTRNEYDVAGQLVRQTDPLGALTQLAYDPKGNLTQLTDARNNRTTFTYDPKDRLQTRTDPLGAVESFVYDQNGHVSRHTDRKQQVTQMTYDAVDRLKTVAFADGSSITYNYDGGGRLMQIVDSQAGTITRTYDDLDRLTNETTPQGSVTYSYDAVGRRATMQVAGQPQVVYSYDNADRLTQITQGANAIVITYDSAGRRSTLTLANGVVLTYGYDANSRLTSISATKGMTQVGNLTYQYDAVGRRTAISGSLARVNLPAALTSASYNAANQLVQWGSTPFTYDANGNLIADGAKTYTWNARNELASMTGAQFVYDGTGRRVSKTITGTTTGFLYDGANLVQEMSGPTLVNWLTGLGVDENFLRTDPAGARSLLTDGLNSTLALMDATGTMVTSYTYEPYGKASWSGAASANSVTYTGRGDDGTGLMYYRARYYQPQLQRFITEDPVGLGGGVNLYAYVEDDPINRSDPFGLWWYTGHNRIFEHALSGMADSFDIWKMKVYSLEFDALTGYPMETAYMHSMRKPGQKPSEAIKLRNDFVKKELQRARQYAAAGNRLAALWHLTQAIHVISDSFSPMHMDENGCPKEWNPNSPDAKKHADWEKNVGANIPPDVLQNTDRLIRNAWEYVFGQ